MIFETAPLFPKKWRWFARHTGTNAKTTVWISKQRHWIALRRRWNARQRRYFAIPAAATAIITACAQIIGDGTWELAKARSESGMRPS